MSIRILQGDCREVLKTLPDESVHCVVTSPPYWGLRDYGVEGQIGLEPSYADYVATMVAVFREVRRVLRKDGTLWLNMGDSYATSMTSDRRMFQPTRDTKRSGGVATQRDPQIPQRCTTGNGLKPKDLCGIPWRVAFALQADGWWLRQDIIWSKPNPMPESVTDRCTKAHEYVFLLSKSERYYYDAEAIREEAAPWNSAIGFNHNGQSIRNIEGRIGNRDDKEQSGRNKRSVWEIATAPFKESHFAVFPPALIEPCVLAGCPKGGIVLDPFGGAGTTGLVADRLGRNAILIELNSDYADMARRRIAQDAGMFAEVI